MAARPAGTKLTVPSQELSYIHPAIPGQEGTKVMFKEALKVKKTLGCTPIS